MHACVVLKPSDAYLSSGVALKACKASDVRSLSAKKFLLMCAVFAPTNAAFQALEANLGYTPEQLLSSSILAPTLKYHVVPGVAAEVIKQAKTCCLIYHSKSPLIWLMRIFMQHYMYIYGSADTGGKSQARLHCCDKKRIALSKFVRCCLQSQSLADNQTLSTLLPGQDLTVFLKGPGRVVISGVQTAANVTQADIKADKVPAPQTQ